MNKKIITAVLAVVIMGGTFYGGMVYAKNAMPSRGQFTNGQFTGNINGARGNGVRASMNGGFTTGEVILKDAGSITIKMQDGSTRIVLVAKSTQVVKSTIVSSNDLVTGINVTVTGTTNSDGSVSAQSVQIRPAGSVPIGGVRTNQ